MNMGEGLILTTKAKVTTSMYEGRSKGASVMAATIRMIICGTNKPKDNIVELIFNHPIEGVVDDKGIPLPPTTPPTPPPTTPPVTVDEKICGVGVETSEFVCKEIDLDR